MGFILGKLLQVLAGIILAAIISIGALKILAIIKRGIKPPYQE